MAPELSNRLGAQQILRLNKMQHINQGGAVKFCLDLDKAETAVRGSWYFPSRLLLALWSNFSRRQGGDQNHQNWYFGADFLKRG